MDLAPATLARRAREARARTHALVDHLDDHQLLGERDVLNPLLWEIGHVAWFTENWVFRRNGEPSIVSHADDLYNSATVAQETRWDLDLHPREATYRYMQDILEKVLARLDDPNLSEEDVFHIAYSIGHEQMHDEAFTYTLQRHAWAAPPDQAEAFAREQSKQARSAGPCPGDRAFSGGTFLLGASRDETFVFDNEKWAHEIEVEPFAIARAAVTQAEFLAFVEDGGYTRDELWCDAGRAWKQDTTHPVYWRKQDDAWQVRRFDTWYPLAEHRPVSHVNWFEASAYCRWAGRRLPTEAEWEYVASMRDGVKLSRPWERDGRRLNTDWDAMGCVDVGALEASKDECLQMMGNVWEWTADAFGPFPGFVKDPYEDYSAPWFGDHMVLKGGSWATNRSLLRTTYRNYFKPHRNDLFAGFRTCACT